MTRRSGMRACAIVALLVMVAAPAWAQGPSANSGQRCAEDTPGTRREAQHQGVRRADARRWLWLQAGADRPLVRRDPGARRRRQLSGTAARRRASKTPRNEDDIEKAAKTKRRHRQSPERVAGLLRRGLRVTDRRWRRRDGRQPVRRGEEPARDAAHRQRRAPQRALRRTWSPISGSKGMVPPSSRSADSGRSSGQEPGNRLGQSPT